MLTVECSAWGIDKWTNLWKASKEGAKAMRNGARAVILVDEMWCGV